MKLSEITVRNLFASSLCLLWLCAGPPARAALIAYDGADYAVTTSIDGRIGGTGWNGSWIGVDNVVAGSLVRNGIVTNGNRFVTDGNSGSARVLETAGRAALLTNGKFGRDGTTLWLSFLFQAETFVPNNYAGLNLYDSEVQQLYIGVPSGSDPRLGLYAPTGGATRFSSIVGTNRQTYFVVVKMIFGAGFTDRVLLFVNPRLDTEPAENSNNAVHTSLSFQFDRITFASGPGATTASFDEFRIGETFADVVPLATNRLVFSAVRPFDPLPSGIQNSGGGLIEGPDGSLYGWATNPSLTPPVSDVVYRVNRDGSGYTELHRFASSAQDGTQPLGVIYASDGRLYGVTHDTRIGGSGHIFSMQPDGSSYSIVKKFDVFADPTSTPRAGLLEGRGDGALYSANLGGSFGGSVYKINKDGSGLQVLHKFLAPLLNPGSTDGDDPQGALAEGPDSKLYGVTRQGGAGASPGRGTIYRLNKDGSGYEVIHSFTMNGQGTHPYGQLRHANDGYVYGMTDSALTATGGSSGAAVFRVRPNGSDYEVIAFVPGGGPPEGGVFVQPGGYVYGSTRSGFGSLFRVRTDKSEFEILHQFALAYVGTEGQSPFGGTIASDSAFYGITSRQSAGDLLFRFGLASAPPVTNQPPVLANPFTNQLAAPNQAFTFTFAANVFTDSDGGQTLGYTVSGLPPGVTFDGATRTFSGTPTQAGDFTVTITATDNGTPPQSANATFKITVSASLPPPVQTLTKLREYGGPNQAQGGLVEGPDGTLYGWDSGSDTNRRGMIFRVKKDGSEFTPLHAFTGATDDGDRPFDLIYGSDNTLYGVATSRVFTLATNGSNYRVRRQWTTATDGPANPFALMEGSDRILYGAAQVGGTLGSSKIWKLNRDGSGYQVVHDFEAGLASPNTTFGDAPNGKPTEGPDGKLYGLATGGTANRGRIYRVNRDGTGFETIHEFAGDGQGSGPFGVLRYFSDGFFHGVGHNGGATNRPVVFKLRPDGSGFQVLLTQSVANSNAGNRLVEAGDGYIYGTSSGGGQFVSGSIYRLKRDGSAFETLYDFSLLNNPTRGISPSPPLHASDGYLYFITLQQTSFVGVGEWRPFLLRFGPVPLPPATPNNSSVTLNPRFDTSGPAGQFKLSFTGTPGREYDIQSTGTLPPSWQSAQKITADAQGNVEFSDNAAANRTARFFRVAQ